MAVTDLYLVDKSALARVARQPTVQAALERLDEEEVLATSPVIDLEIAATAETYGAVVIHYDRNFDVIAAVTAQPARWIVPAGSVPWRPAPASAETRCV